MLARFARALRGTGACADGDPDALACFFEDGVRACCSNVRALSTGEGLSPVEPPANTPGDGIARFGGVGGAPPPRTEMAAIERAESEPTPGAGGRGLLSWPSGLAALCERCGTIPPGGAVARRRPMRNSWSRGSNRVSYMLGFGTRRPREAAVLAGSVAPSGARARNGHKQKKLGVVMAFPHDPILPTAREILLLFRCLPPRSLWRFPGSTPLGSSRIACLLDRDLSSLLAFAAPGIQPDDSFPA